MVHRDESCYINKKVFKQIFKGHWDIYKKMYTTREIEDESVQKMLSCGEKANGYAEYISTNCGEKRKIIPFTCKSRFCPSCGKRYTDRWVKGIKETLLDLVHRHIVFTIPEGLRRIIHDNRELLKGMVEASATVSKEIMRE